MGTRDDAARETLATLIATAARAAFSDLFATHAEAFYYCTLVTSAEAHTPRISAWSTEALQRMAAENSATAARCSKWSYADSPYCFFGEEHFAEVDRVCDALRASLA